jgi:hypothetical protein
MRSDKSSASGLKVAVSWEAHSQWRSRRLLSVGVPPGTVRRPPDAPTRRGSADPPREGFVPGPGLSV